MSWAKLAGTSDINIMVIESLSTSEKSSRHRHNNELSVDTVTRSNFTVLLRYMNKLSY